MRTFYLNRKEDVSGTSGTGIVAEGCEFEDGSCVMLWLTDTSSTCLYGSAEDIETIHSHEGATEIVWEDEMPEEKAAQLRLNRLRVANKLWPRTITGKHRKTANAQTPEIRDPANKDLSKTKAPDGYETDPDTGNISERDLEEVLEDSLSLGVRTVLGPKLAQFRGLPATRENLAKLGEAAQEELLKWPTQYRVDFPNLAGKKNFSIGYRELDYFTDKVRQAARVSGIAIKGRDQDQWWEGYTRDLHRARAFMRHLKDLHVNARRIRLYAVKIPPMDKTAQRMQTQVSPTVEGIEIQFESTTLGLEELTDEALKAVDEMKHQLTDATIRGPVEVTSAAPGDVQQVKVLLTFEEGDTLDDDMVGRQIEVLLEDQGYTSDYADIVVADEPETTRTGGAE